MGLGIHVGGAVHRENVLLGQHIVHRGEDALLDLACVLRAADDDHVCLIVDHDGSLGVDTVNHGIALKAGGAENGVIRVAVSGKLFRGRTDEELMDEEVLRSKLVDDAELLGMCRIGTCEAVENEDLTTL